MNICKADSMIYNLLALLTCGAFITCPLAENTKNDSLHVSDQMLSGDSHVIFTVEELEA